MRIIRASTGTFVFSQYGDEPCHGVPQPRNAFVCFLHKDNIAIDNQGVPILIPEFCLGGFSDAGRAEKHQAVTSVVDEGTVELDHVALDGVGVEELE